MLLSYYLSNYAKKNSKQLVLLHINYNNRTTCKEEVEFLKLWSKVIDSELHIKEMTIQRERSSKYRENYEKITRDLRYEFYRSFCPVVLGHNKDDCYENVFANLSKQIHFENLYGMKEVLSEQEITIVRPFLEIYKKDIIKKAHELHIPYLEDSTPAWSRRGKMRDSLIPVIQNFDPHILRGVDEYISYTKIEDYWESNFNEWKTVTINSDSFTIDKTNKFYQQNYKQLYFG